MITLTEHEIVHEEVRDNFLFVLRRNKRKNIYGDGNLPRLAAVAHKEWHIEVYDRLSRDTGWVGLASCQDSQYIYGVIVRYSYRQYGIGKRMMQIMLEEIVQQRGQRTHVRLNSTEMGSLLYWSLGFRFRDVHSNKYFPCFKRWVNEPSDEILEDRIQNSRLIDDWRPFGDMYWTPEMRTW
jgi:ribosomal protein S18 acetylase RimI-like enzyme